MSISGTQCFLSKTNHYVRLTNWTAYPLSSKFYKIVKKTIDTSTAKFHYKTRQFSRSGGWPATRAKLLFWPNDRYNNICKTSETHFQKVNPSENCCWVKFKRLWLETSAIFPCVLGKPQFEKCRVYLGIAQIAFDPPPSLKRARWGTLFPGRPKQMPFELQFSLHKCPKPSWQGFRPPKNKQMPLWTWTILL